MKSFFLWALAFLAFFGLSFGLGSLGIPAWPTITILLLVAATLSLLPKLSAYQRLACILCYCSTFLVLWLHTNVYGIRGKTFSLLYQATLLAGLLIAVISFLVFLIVALSKSDGRKTLFALIPLFVMGWLIALFSGDAGGADPMMRMFLNFGLSPGAAEVAVVISRKTIHFVFYGLLAAFSYRATVVGGTPRSSMLTFAVVFPLLHAVFDETRQTFSHGRTGSFWDVLLDLAGMAFFLWAVGAFRAPRKQTTAAK